MADMQAAKPNEPAEISEATLREIIRAGESIAVEFKSRPPPDGEFAALISAFSNSEGGHLIIGVGDDGNVLGISEADAGVSIERITRLTRVMLSQPVTPHEIVYQGSRLVYAYVPAAPPGLRPIVVPHGQAFERLGASTRRSGIDRDALRGFEFEAALGKLCTGDVN